VLIFYSYSKVTCAHLFRWSRPARRGRTPPAWWRRMAQPPPPRRPSPRAPPPTPSPRPPCPRSPWPRSPPAPPCQVKPPRSPRFNCPVGSQISRTVNPIMKTNYKYIQSNLCMQRIIVVRLTTCSSFLPAFRPPARSPRHLHHVLPEHQDHDRLGPPQHLQGEAPAAAGRGPVVLRQQFLPAGLCASSAAPAAADPPGLRLPVCSRWDQRHRRLVVVLICSVIQTFQLCISYVTTTPYGRQNDEWWVGWG